MTIPLFISESCLIYLACGVAVTLAAGTPLEIVDAFSKASIRRHGRLPGDGAMPVVWWLAVVVWPGVFWKMAVGSRGLR